MTDEQIVAITELIYRDWSDKAATLLTAKKERNDGSPDWQQFHDLRLENAERAERNARELRDAWNLEHREVLHRALGI